MPELPEAETIASELQAEVAGAVIARAAVLRKLSTRGTAPARFCSRVKGASVIGAARRGKWPVLALDGGRFLVVRLGMSGKLLLCQHDDPRPKWTRVALTLDDGREIRFVDPRAFGWISLESGAPFHSLGAFQRLGPEPLSDDWSVERLLAGLAGRRAGLQRVLLDGRLVAGIGKIYADEICFRARLHPEKEAGRLTRADAQRLRRAARQVLSRAIAHRGTSANDGAYVDLYGKHGSYQKWLAVYQRAGKPCVRCGTPIRRLPMGYGRGMHFCPRCQPRSRKRHRYAEGKPP